MIGPGSDKKATPMAVDHNLWKTLIFLSNTTFIGVDSWINKVLRPITNVNKHMVMRNQNKE